MGRINLDEVDQYSQYDNDFEWLKLQNDGDCVRVQFLYKNINDLDVYACHKVKVQGKNGEFEKYVSCNRSYDDPIDMCPLCAAGLKVDPVLYVSMYDLNDNKVKLWQRGKTFIKKMQGLFNRYPHLSKYVFDIERNGAKGDQKTTYELYPCPEEEAVDLEELGIEKPKILGSVIWDKTPDDMQVYLDTGSFPKPDEEQEEESTPTRRNNRRNSDVGVSRRSRRG